MGSLCPVQAVLLPHGDRYFCHAGLGTCHMPEPEYRGWEEPAMKIHIAALIIFLSVGMLVSATGTGEILRVPGRSSFKKLSRPEVKFDHDRHYMSGVYCLQCHHRFERGNNVLKIDQLKAGTGSALCASCHTTDRRLERAYHRLCISCHTQMRKENRKTGPVMCGLCHTVTGG